MRSIKRISAMSLVYARKHCVPHKAKELMTAITITTAGTAAFYNSSKVIPKLIFDEFTRNPKYIAEPVSKAADKIKTKSFSSRFDWSFAKSNNALFEPSFLKEQKAAAAIKKVFDAKTKKITKIMDEDRNFVCHFDKDTIAAQIVRTAQKYELNPIHIACIAKKETHFTQNLNSNGAKGMMQITMGALSAMYKYPQNFNPKLNEIKKTYPTARKLFDALGKEPELNVEVGAILFETCLKIAKGNVTKALELYNGSTKKQQYAESVFADIKKYS